MKMDTKELKELEVAAEALALETKKKELIELNRAQANAMLLRMLSNMNPEVLDISTGVDSYE